MKEVKEVMQKVREIEQRHPDETIFTIIEGLEDLPAEKLARILTDVFPKPIYYPDDPTGPLPFSPSDPIPIYVPLCPITHFQRNIADRFPKCDENCRKHLEERT